MTHLLSVIKGALLYTYLLDTGWYRGQAPATMMSSKLLATTLAAVTFLALAGCDEPVSPTKPKPTKPAPEPTPTQLLVGSYEYAEDETTYPNPLILHSDGSVTLPGEEEYYVRWWFYPGRRALSLAYPTWHPAVEVSRAKTVIVPQGWRTGDTLCLFIFIDEETGNEECVESIRRTPAPQDGGSLLKTTAQDDLPSGWAGDYIIRARSSGNDEFSIFATYTLRPDGVAFTAVPGLYAPGEQVPTLQGEWWFDASNRALSVTITVLNQIETMIFREGWDGTSACIYIDSSSSPPSCNLTIERVP